jgi:hypothetical protein
MSVLEAADDALRCLRKRQTVGQRSSSNSLLIAAEIDGMIDVLELQAALRRLRLSMRTKNHEAN